MLTIERAACGETVPGDIVLLLRGHRFFVHRLIARRKRSAEHCWVKRGDSLPQNDLPAARHPLLGGVSTIHRGHREDGKAAAKGNAG